MTDGSAEVIHSEVPGAGLHVLVIEDDDFMRSVVARLLRRLGVTDITEAANGRDALAAVRGSADRPFHLLVCDLDMPESDGMEFMRLASEQKLETPLLVLSGKTPAVLRSVAIMAAEYGLTLVGAAQKPPTVALLRDALVACTRVVRRGPAQQGRTFSSAELIEALDQQQFEPFFQPKVDIRSNKVCGCEALVRWRHPEHGVLAPGAFLRDLEAGGLMDRLTWSVFEQSARWCRHWRDMGQVFPVSVNLSMASFEDTQLSTRVLDIVKAAGLTPADFTIEVTETIAMSSIARCLESLVRLRLRGFGLSIDDFGTGFSSLQQLERVPYTELKIDRAFVDGAARQERLRAVLESSITVATRLGLTTVAEGVEQPEDLACVRDHGCEIAQGYLISKPIAGGDFLRWVNEWEQRAAA